MGPVVFRVCACVFVVGMLTGADRCCPPPCPGGSNVGYRSIRTLEFTVAANRDRTCLSNGGATLTLDTSKAYKFTAIGLVTIQPTTNTVSGPAGNGSPAPGSFPAPGLPRHSLVGQIASRPYFLVGDSLPPAGQNTGPHIVGKGYWKFDSPPFNNDEAFCFRVNDDYIEDNSGAYLLSVEVFETYIVCVNHCGDGHLDPNEGEECDDGNRVAGDGCSATCKAECPVCPAGYAADEKCRCVCQQASCMCTNKARTQERMCDAGSACLSCDDALCYPKGACAKCCSDGHGVTDACGEIDKVCN